MVFQPFAFSWVSSTSGQQYNRLTKRSFGSFMAPSLNSSLFRLLSGRYLLSLSLNVLVSYGLLPPNYRLLTSNYGLPAPNDSLLGANETLIS